MNCRLCHQPTVTAFKSTNIHGHQIINQQKYQLYFCRYCQSYSLENIDQHPDYYQQAYNLPYYPSSSPITRILNFISFSLRRLTISLSLRWSHHPISILDIGCGQGEFLSSLPLNRYHLNGVEINPQAVKLIKNKHIHLFVGDFNQIDFGSSRFDCITLWHVLEHLPKPKVTLTKIFQLLKPGGIILAATPCSQSAGFRLGQKNYFHLDSPRHLFIPSILGLKTLFNQTGFKNSFFLNPFYDYPLDLFWSVRRSIFRFLIYCFYPVIKLFSFETILTLASKPK